MTALVAAFLGTGGLAATQLVPSSAGSYATGKDIAIQSLSASQWRVCDSRWPEHDARSLLGFIEKKDDLFEVMELDHGFAWFSFASLAQATDHFAHAKPTAAPNGENILSRLRAHA